MINMQLQTMKEYKPVNGHHVDLFLADKSWFPCVSIQFNSAVCHIHYQQYCAKDRTPNPTSEGHTDEMMAKIPFDTPFVHICEPFGDQRDGVSERIIGFRLLEEHEFEKMAEAASRWYNLCMMRSYQKREDMNAEDPIDWQEAVDECEEDYEPYKDIPVTYSEKRWYFVLKNDNQIDQDDPGNKVLGIVDGDYIAEQFKDLI